MTTFRQRHSFLYSLIDGRWQFYMMLMLARAAQIAVVHGVTRELFLCLGIAGACWQFHQHRHCPK